MEKHHIIISREMWYELFVDNVLVRHGCKKVQLYMVDIFHVAQEGELAPHPGHFGQVARRRQPPAADPRFHRRPVGKPHGVRQQHKAATAGRAVLCRRWSRCSVSPLVVLFRVAAGRAVPCRRWSRCSVSKLVAILGATGGRGFVRGARASHGTLHPTRKVHRKRRVVPPRMREERP